MNKQNHKGLKKHFTRAIILSSAILIPYTAFAQWAIPAPPTGLTDVELGDVLSRVIIGILQLASLIGIAYLVWGGITYVRSSGNDSDIEEAKNTITYAVWGLFLIASAYAIVKLVVDTVG